MSDLEFTPAALDRDGELRIAADQRLKTEPSILTEEVLIYLLNWGEFIEDVDMVARAAHELGVRGRALP